MVLFMVRGCLLQVVLTDCPSQRVPDLEAVMDRAGAYVAGGMDCGALARLLRPLVEGLAGCRVLVEPFPRSQRELGLARLG